jgi:hypothetical protein
VWTFVNDKPWQRDLWLDLTRRVPDACVTGPAGLAAWCARMRGEDALAAAAIRRVLTVDPTDAMTRVIDMAVQAHIPARAVVEAWPPATTAIAGRGSA